MLRIYHNPKCSKSRQALEIINDNNVNVEVILYAKTGWEKDNLMQLITKSGGDIHKILRPADKFYKEYDLSNKSVDEIIATAIEHPTVIERPLIETEEVAFIARPPELVNDVL